MQKIFNGGQIFTWVKYCDGYRGIIDGIPFFISYKDNSLYVITSVHELISKQKIIDFFDLTTSVKNIEKQLTSYNDSYMDNAILKNRGLRILKQDPWVCIVSFICSSVANFNKISQNIKNISEHLGEKIIFNGHTFYTFPEPEVVAESSIELLREFGLGFRSKYVLDLAMKIRKELFNLEILKTFNYLESRSRLESLYGVGSKIADCVLLYSLNKTESFPIDRWVARALRDGYSLQMKNNYNYASEWARNNWKEKAGYAQQYLFQYQKELNNENK